MRFRIFLLSCWALSLGDICRAQDLSQARQLIDSRKVPEAKALLEAYRQNHREDAESSFLLGLCHLRMNQLESAVPLLERASNSAPTNADYLTELGNAYLLQANKNTSFSLAKKGRAALEKAVELNPAKVDAHSALVLFFSRAPWIAGGDMDKAAKHAKAVRQHDPHQGLVMLVALKNQQKKFDEALALCDEVLRADPSDFFAHYEIGRTAALSGKHLERGIASLQKCLALPLPSRFPNYCGTHLRLGQLQEKKGDLEAARACYRACLDIEPSHKQARDALVKLSGRASCTQEPLLLPTPFFRFLPPPFFSILPS